jgi:hypothetical protein
MEGKMKEFKATLKKFVPRLFLLVIFLMPIISFAEDFEVSDIKVKEIETDSSGDVWFAIKVDVHNYGEQGKIIINVQGVDDDGFEIVSVSLFGDFARNQSKSITTKSYTSRAKYDWIKKWQVKSAIK